jgi:hypothetical protein
MAIPVPTEIPVTVAILIMFPNFAVTFAVIIYTHNKTRKSNHNNDNDNDNNNDNDNDPDNNNRSRGKNIIGPLFRMKHSSRYNQQYQQYQ